MVVVVGVVVVVIQREIDDDRNPRYLADCIYYSTLGDMKFRACVHDDSALPAWFPYAHTFELHASGRTKRLRVNRCYHLGA